MNSETPSVFVAVGEVEVRFMRASVGVTPTILFPKTSETVALCLEIVEVYGLAGAV